MLRVLVAGATGRTGSEAARAIRRTDDLQLVGALARSRGGEDLGTALGDGDWGVPIETDLAPALARSRPDVLVDLTLGESAGAHALAALRHGTRVVIGATGLPAGDIEAIRAASAQAGLGAALVPNFSFGVLLLAHFCREAARFFPDAEIVELHHATKRDRPSGTAAALRQVLEEAGAAKPVAVHSIRLPGHIAHHQIIFGGPGETLTLRHDTTSRASFAPGILLCIRRVMRFSGLVEGLEALAGD